MLWAAIVNFDIRILHWLNAFGGRSPHFDKIIEYLNHTQLRYAVIVCFCWWCWFRDTDASARTQARRHLLRTFAAGIVAIFVARLLALTLPFRVRPRFEPAVHFVASDPYSTDLIDWSSFPSDHAVMFSALAVGLCFVSWRAGLLALLYTVLIIDLPRIYLGIHYPTDIIAGLVLGAVISYAMNVVSVFDGPTNWALRWERESPGVFYAALFFVTLEFSTMFESVRELAARVTTLAAYLTGSR